MSALYFDKHPSIIYDTVRMKNLMKRVRVIDEVFTNATNFYPYVIQEGERIDTVAYNYYGDSELTWLVMISNDLVDPYYDWYLTTRQFERFIKSKYGSIAAAQATTVHYKHNTENYIVSNATVEEPDPATGLTYGGESVNNFSAIDAYTYEFDLNEQRKFIQLLDRILVPKVTEELRILLDE